MFGIGQEDTWNSLKVLEELMPALCRSSHRGVDEIILRIIIGFPAVQRAGLGLGCVSNLHIHKSASCRIVKRHPGGRLAGNIINERASLEQAFDEPFRK